MRFLVQKDSGFSLINISPGFTVLKKVNRELVRVKYKFVVLSLIPGIRAVCTRLWVSDTGQRLPSAQAGHQGAEEGPQALDVGGQDESVDQEDHLSGAAGHVRGEEGVRHLVVT